MMTQPRLDDHADASLSPIRRLVALLSTLALMAAFLVLGATAPAHAAPIEVPDGTFVTITAGQQVFGDVTSTGNGMLTCGNCTLHVGAPGSTNNSVPMTYIDMDADATTFNSSSGELTIPAGSTVAKAWLMWEATGTQCTSTTSGFVPIATVRANAPLLSLNGGAYVSVGEADYIAESPVLPSTIINAAVDVTTELAGLTGGTHSVMLANLASSQGMACTSGWAMHVSYDYGTFTPGNPDSAPQKIYTAFGVATVFNSTETVTFSGFQTSAPGATLLLTAADGEPSAGDSTSVVWAGGSEPLPNAATPPVTNNAFNSFMNGANSYAPGVSNAAFHNGSIDTYKTTSVNLPTGSTSVDFRFESVGDGYFAHSVSMAIPVAQIDVTKSPATGTVDGQIASVGQAPLFQIVIDNQSAVEVSGVTFVEPDATSCTLNGTPLVLTGTTFTIPTPLAAGSQTVVLCTGRVVAEGDANYVNTVTVTGSDPNGAPVTDSDESQILIPHLTLTKSVDRPVVEEGETVTWSIAVLNDGGTELRNVVVDDSNCAGPLTGPAGTGAPDVLAQGVTWTYTCTQPVLVDTTNTADVIADPFTTIDGVEIVGGPVTDQDDAVVDVEPTPVASINLTKTVDRDAVEEGETVTWTMVALNDGDQDLRDVVLTDSNCGGSLSAPSGPGAPNVLAQGDSWTYTCSEAVTEDTTNTAGVTATPFRLFNGVEVESAPVTDEDDAEVIITAPAPDASISLVKSVDLPVVEEGGTVTWTVVVTNDGDQDLRDVVLTDADCTGTMSAPTGPGAPTVLAQGDSWTYTCAEAVTASKSNTASVVATPFRVVNGVEIEDTPVTDEDTESVTVTPPVAHLTLTKSVDRPAVEEGETVTWTMVVLNDGGQDVRDVVLTDSNCSGSLSAPSGPGAPNVLAQGDSWSYTCSEVVTADTTNTAGVTATPFRTVNGQEVEGEPVSDSDDEFVEVTPAPVASILLGKTVDPASVVEGGTVTWTMVVTNNGLQDLRDVVLTDTDCTGTLSRDAVPHGERCRDRGPAGH
jgi:uncharacterized repeat protein (TIGR01451 family)